MNQKNLSVSDNNLSNYRFRIKDILAVLIVGETSGWLLLVVVRNLMSSAPQLSIIPLWFWPVFFPIFCLIWFLTTLYLSRIWRTFYQLGKFVLVGGMNFLVDLGILNLLIFFSNVASGGLFSVFKGIAFIVAVTNSYFWNKLWTFKDPKEDPLPQTLKKEAGKEFLQFITVSVIGLLINNITASLIVWINPVAGLSPELWANVAAIVASFVGMFWNFMGYKFIVFRSK